MDALGLLFSCVFLLILGKINNCHGDGTTEPPSEYPVVQTSDGPVKGYSFTSPWTKQLIYAFSGVPYAAPPIGKLRFKDPVAVHPWSAVRDCTLDQVECVQSKGDTGPPSDASNEDCLYLSVYTPRLYVRRGLLPVMVWVHGGGFVTDSGNRRHYRPDMLVAEGVVVVIMNYRLGVFGFLNLGTQDISGNAGLKDQRLALVWVQREITKFGGDPGQVTLFGESAGSASVHLHYLSPLSKGLFHKVIGQSGTSLSWAVRDNNNTASYGLRFAAAMNCSTGSAEEDHSCLRAAPAADLLEAQNAIQPTENIATDSLHLTFVPTIDKHTSTEPFLPDHPAKLIKHLRGPPMPFLMGLNSDEGILLTFDDKLVPTVKNHLEDFLPKEARKTNKTRNIQRIAHQLNEFYFKNSTFGDSKYIRGFVDIFSDYMFGYDTIVCARHFKIRGPVFLYYFTFNGAFKEDNTKQAKAKYNISGVSHAEELGYLFVSEIINQTAAADSKEMHVWRRMARLWTNFAKYSTPTIGADPLLQHTSWTPIDHGTYHYLRIGENLTMEHSDLLAHSTSLWDLIKSETKSLTDS